MIQGDLERICGLLWQNRKWFEMFDALALYRVQNGMLQLPVTYVKSGEIVKSIQFLRRFFLSNDIVPVPSMTVSADSSNNSITGVGVANASSVSASVATSNNGGAVPLQRQAKIKVLLLLGNVLCRYMTDHLYRQRSVDAPDSLTFNEMAQVSEMRKLEQPPPRMVRSRTATRLAMKNAQATMSDNDVFIVAQNWVEEALLTLLSLERLTNPVSSRFGYKISSSNNNTSVTKSVTNEILGNLTLSQLYDNVTMLLSEHKKYYSLMNILERGLSRYNEDVHFWNQFALVLIKSKKYYRALKVLEEIILIDPLDANSHLLIAKVCLQHVPGKTQLALEHAKQAVGIQGFFSGKSYHVLGLVYEKLAKESHSRTERSLYIEKALESLKIAHEFDPDDHLVCYHLALHYAESRDAQKALSHVRKSLSLHARFVPSWTLLVLLFTSDKDYVQALKTVKIALVEHPKNIELTLLSARLHEIVTGQDKAIRVYDKLQVLLKSYSMCENVRLQNVSQEASGDGRSNPSVPDGLYFKIKSRAFKMAKYNLFVSDALRRLELDANNAPRVLTKILEAKELVGSLILESSIDLNTLTIPPQSTSAAADQAGNAFFDAFEAFISNSHQFVTNLDAASMTQIQDICADVCFHEGRYREETGDMDSAIKRYESALVCNCNHLSSLIRLGIALYGQDEHKRMLARSYLQTAVQVDPLSYEAWYHLGIVQKMMGDLQGSSESLMASLKLEQTAPIIAYDQVLRPKMH